MKLYVDLTTAIRRGASQCDRHRSIFNPLRCSHTNGPGGCGGEYETHYGKPACRSICSCGSVFCILCRVRNRRGRKARPITPGIHVDIGAQFPAPSLCTTALDYLFALPDHFVRCTPFGPQVEHVRLNKSAWALANCPVCHAHHDRFRAFMQTILNDIVERAVIGGEPFIGVDVQRDALIFSEPWIVKDTGKPTIKECDDQLAELRDKVRAEHERFAAEKRRHEGELESLNFARDCWRTKVQELRTRSIWS